MFHIACTRFNTQTYKENMDYRAKYNEAVIYGPAYKIRDIYSAGSLIFVVEMNNETNKIEGIGLIANLTVSDKYYKIYSELNYNRHIYRGKYWLSRHHLDSEIVEIFDNILFKGKSNMKRMSGITILTEKLFTNWDYELRDLKNKVKTAFLSHFKQPISFDTEENNEETKEVFDIIPKKRNKSMKETKL